MNDKQSAVLMLGVIIVIASAMTCLFAFLMASHFDDTDKYDVSRDYDVSGTVTENLVVYDCTGAGRSEYINESGSDRIYTFKFTVRYSESSEKDLEFDLLCDHSGVPLKELYDKVSESEDTSVWKYTEKELTYVFSIGEYCKVYSMEMTGDGLALKAVLKE